MGKTVIESLLIELGLDTEKLKESAAIDKIEKIRSSVKGLNDDLGDVEKRLKGLGMSVGGFGKSTKGVKAATSTQAVKPSTSTPIPVKDPANTKAVVEQTKKDEKYRKTPSTMKGMLTGAGGLGNAAAGMYLLKSITDGLKSFFESARNYLAGSQAMKQAGEQIGLSAEQMKYFETVSKSFGDDTGSIAQGIAELGKSYISTIPGQFHKGLENMRIPVLNPDMSPRSIQDVIGDIADQAAKMPKKSQLTYKYFADRLPELPKQAIDMLQEGRGGMETRYQSMLKAGMTKPESQISREVMTKNEMTAASQTAETFVSKISDFATSMFAREFGSWTGKEGYGMMQEFYNRNPATAVKNMRAAGYGNVQLQNLKQFFPTAPGMEDVKVSAMDRMTDIGSHSLLVRGLQSAMQKLVVDKMTLNLSIDKSGNAVGTMNGIPIGSISTNVSPNKAVQ